MSFAPRNPSSFDQSQPPPQQVPQQHPATQQQVPMQQVPQHRAPQSKHVDFVAASPEEFFRRFDSRMEDGKRNVDQSRLNQIIGAAYEYFSSVGQAICHSDITLEVCAMLDSRLEAKSQLMARRALKDKLLARRVPNEEVAERHFRAAYKRYLEYSNARGKKRVHPSTGPLIFPNAAPPKRRRVGAAKAHSGRKAQPARKAQHKRGYTEDSDDEDFVASEESEGDADDEYFTDEPSSDMDVE